MCTLAGLEDSLVLKAEIGGVSQDCLVDTGASVSLVSANIGAKGSISTAYRQEAEISKWSRARCVWRGGAVCSYWRLGYEPPFVVCSLTTGPVLGADFLSGHEMSVDLKEGKLHWAEGRVNLRTPGTRNKCYAVLMEDVRLDGNTRVVVSAEVVREEIYCGNDIVSGSDVWLLESEEQLQKTDAIAARAVVDVDSGTVPVQIMSLGTTVELPKETKIAAIERAMV